MADNVHSVADLRRLLSLGVDSADSSRLPETTKFDIDDDRTNCAVFVVRFVSATGCPACSRLDREWQKLRRLSAFQQQQEADVRFVTVSSPDVLEYADVKAVPTVDILISTRNVGSRTSSSGVDTERSSRIVGGALCEVLKSAIVSALARVDRNCLQNPSTSSWSVAWKELSWKTPQSSPAVHKIGPRVLLRALDLSGSASTATVTVYAFRGEDGDFDDDDDSASTDSNGQDIHPVLVMRLSVVLTQPADVFPARVLNAGPDRVVLAFASSYQYFCVDTSGCVWELKVLVGVGVGVGVDVEWSLLGRGLPDLHCGCARRGFAAVYWKESDIILCSGGGCDVHSTRSTEVHRFCFDSAPGQWELVPTAIAIDTEQHRLIGRAWHQSFVVDNEAMHTQLVLCGGEQPDDGALTSQPGGNEPAELWAFCLICKEWKLLEHALGISRTLHTLVKVDCGYPSFISCGGLMDYEPLDDIGLARLSFRHEQTLEYSSRIRPTSAKDSVVSACPPARFKAGLIGVPVAGALWLLVVGGSRDLCSGDDFDDIWLGLVQQ